MQCMGRGKATGIEPRGEDLPLRRIDDVHGVEQVSDLALATEGMCEAGRAVREEKNKNQLDAQAMKEDNDDLLRQKTVAHRTSWAP